MNVELVISQPWVTGILTALLVYALVYAGYVQRRLMHAEDLLTYMGFDPFSRTWDLERFERFGRSLRVLSLRRGTPRNLKTPRGNEDG